MLRGLGESLQVTLRKLRGLPVVDKEALEEVLKELERALLSSDVQVELVQQMINNVRERSFREDIPPGISRRDYVIKVIYDELTKLLGKRYYPLHLVKGQLTKIMLVGIQGSGKTTTLAKLARYYQKRGYKVAAIAGDTFRPGAYDQLKQLLEPIGVEVYGEPNEKKSTKVVKNGLKYFEKKKIDLLLIDTAGRHKEEKGLLKEMQQIAKIVKPDEIILVIDGTIGQQAYVQADAFNRTTPVGSIIVTKLDGSSKGGGAVSAVAATGAKIRFYGDGETIEDLEEFDPVRFVANLLGLGDLQGILQRIAEATSTEQQEELMEAFKRGKITLHHFKMQLESVAEAGTLRRILSKLPGVGKGGPFAGLPVDEMDDESVKVFLAILRAMTKEELDNPKIIKGSRIQRIALGSGTHPELVRALLKQFNQTQAMLKRMRKMRKQRGVAGMGGLSGMQGPPI